MAEQLPLKEKVEGSIPSGFTRVKRYGSVPDLDSGGPGSTPGTLTNKLRAGMYQGWRRILAISLRLVRFQSGPHIRVRCYGSMRSLGLCGAGSTPAILTTLVGEVETRVIANHLCESSILSQVSNNVTNMLQCIHGTNNENSPLRLEWLL